MDGVLQFSAGEAADVECGRPCTTRDMHGRTVTFTDESLAAIATTLDPEESQVRIGHVEVATDTPFYGSVTALRYDSARARLVATFVPTPALVRRNREEKFGKASMELAGTPPRGPFRFLHLALLAARKPAISGLAPVMLAAPDGADLHMAMAASIGLNPNVRFAKSELHERALVRLASVREIDPETTYTQAIEAVDREDNQFPLGTSPFHEKVKAYLGEHRKERLTYTQASEIVGELEAAEFRRAEG